MNFFTPTGRTWLHSFRNAFIVVCGSLLLITYSEVTKADVTMSEAGQNDASKSVEISKDSFKCLTEMTPVRGFFVDNLLGNLKDTLAAANAKNGAVYPVGSVVQLVPTEVMVKRENGYNATTKDWEFFELAVSPQGSEISVRGAFEVVNKFGGNCFACHIKAKPQWDMICEQDHGCEPITFKHEGKEVTLTQAMIKGVQKADPRCVNPNEVDAI